MCLKMRKGKRSPSEFNPMSDIIDLIYEVFEEINRAKEAEDFKLLEEKEKQLDELRAELASGPQTKVTRI